MLDDKHRNREEEPSYQPGMVVRRRRGENYSGQEVPWAGGRRLKAMDAA